MTDTLTVLTGFTDVAEMAEGLTDRIDDERLILYGPEPLDEGASITFAIVLADNTVALGGRAIASASFDGGSERVAEARFDIVLEQLEMDPQSQLVFEHILTLRHGASASEAAREDPIEEDMTSFDESIVQVETGDVDSYPAGDNDGPHEHDTFAGENLQTDSNQAQVSGIEILASTAGETPGEDALGYVPAIESHRVASEDEFDGTSTQTMERPWDFDAEDHASQTSSLEVDSRQDLPVSVQIDEPSTPTSDFEDSNESAWNVVSSELEVADVGTDEAAGGTPDDAAAASASLMRPPSMRPYDAGGSSGGHAPEGYVHLDGMLSRPSKIASWHPAASQRSETIVSTGLFDHLIDHQGALPIPDKPPRPEIDPELQVNRAPRPKTIDADRIDTDSAT
ncbi:MAG: hypothetical protein AAF550_05535 [Myxococcota bacterium]